MSSARRKKARFPHYELSSNVVVTCFESDLDRLVAASDDKKNLAVR